MTLIRIQGHTINTSDIRSVSDIQEKGPYEMSSFVIHLYDREPLKVVSPYTHDISKWIKYQEENRLRELYSPGKLLLRKAHEELLKIWGKTDAPIIVLL